MGRIELGSASDPRLDVYRDLKQTDSTVSRNPRRDTFVVEGDKLVFRLLASRCEVLSIVCSPSMCEQFEAIAPPEVPVFVLPVSELSALIGFKFHRGVLACGRRLPDKSSTELLNELEAVSRPLVVVCPDLRDPENLGTIARTALAFGAHALCLGVGGTDPLTRRTLRTSMGALLTLPHVRSECGLTLLTELHARNYVSVAMVLADDALPLEELASRPGQGPDRVAIWLGNEHAGLPNDLARQCRRRITLPMNAGVDSLNVAVAAGIVLHHFRRTGIPPG